MKTQIELNDYTLTAETFDVWYTDGTTEINMQIEMDTLLKYIVADNLHITVSDAWDYANDCHTQREHKMNPADYLAEYTDEVLTTYITDMSLRAERMVA